MTLEAGTTLGPYCVQRQLGAGGMGEVYAALDGRLGRTVAIKVLPREMVQDPETLRRFQQEANTVASLNHPNIVQIYDVGTSDDGYPYLVMELLEGEPLRARMESKPMPLRKVVEISAQLAKALGAAHSKGIVHRDLKPENVYLTKPGPAKILDFGLAKLSQKEEAFIQDDATRALFTKPGMVMGTVGYMAPEQVEGHNADGRADIFALGIIMWEMASGQRPFRKDSSIDTLHAILREDPPEIPAELGLPPAMERILRRCLEKDPEDRFQSANDLAFQLASLAEMSSSIPTVRISAITEAEPKAPWHRTPHRLFYPLPIKLPGKLQVCFWDRVQLSVAYLVLLALGGVLLGSWLGVLPFQIGGNRELGKSFTPALNLTGNIQSAAVSRDGQHYLVSMADESGKATLIYYRAGQSALTLDKVAGEEVLALTNTGSALLRSSNGDLYLQEMAEHASAMKIATKVLESDLTPDGSKVALLKRAGDKFSIEFPQGSPVYSSPQRLRDLKVSPKGDAVAFFERDPATNLFQLRIWHKGRMETWKGGEGLSPKGAFSMGGLRGMAWDASGEALYLASGTLLGYLDGKRERILHRNAGSLRLCGATQEGPLLLVGTELLSERGRIPGASQEVDLGWIGGNLAAMSRDGSRFLVARDEEIWLLPADRSKGRKIGTGTAEALSADGRTILFTNNERTLAVPTEGGDSVLIANREELKAQGFSFTGESTDPKYHLSEDGKWLLVLQRKLLARRPMDASSPFEKLSPPMEGMAEDWRIDNLASPDGQRVVLQVRESGEKRWCLQVDLATSKQELRVSLEDTERLMAWQKDGGYLLFSSSKGAAEFRSLDPKNGQRRVQVAPAPPFPSTAARFRNVRCSSDGAFYAYRYASAGISQLLIGKGF